MSDDNGVLAWVPGHLVGGASHQLPPPGPDQEANPVRRVIVEVPDLGLVELTFELRKMTHRRSTHWAWLPLRADLDQPAKPTA